MEKLPAEPAWPLAATEPSIPRRLNWAAPPRGAHPGSGGIRSTGQTGLNRTVPLTPDPARATIDVDVGIAPTGAAVVVVARVDRAATTDVAVTVEVGADRTEEVVVSDRLGADVTGVVVVGPPANRT